MSPTSSTSGKKLEWDSGADVGYLNLDLSKENLSTIERIILRGLSNDGKSEKKVVYEKKPEQSETRSNRSKFILERMPSELVIEEIAEDKNTGDGLAINKEIKNVNEDVDQTLKMEKATLTGSKDDSENKEERKKEDQDESAFKIAKGSKQKKTGRKYFKFAVMIFLFSTSHS